MRGRACSASFMRRFKALVDKDMTDAELAEWFCFGVSEAHMLRKAVETMEKVTKQQKEPTSNIQISECSKADVDTAQLDFERIPPSTMYEISRAPEEKQLELAVRTAHYNLTGKYMKKKVDLLVGKPIEEPKVIDTGLKFTCPECGKSYMLLHVSPKGEHRFQEVHEV